MDIISISTLITAIATLALVGATFYYAFTNRKLVLAKEKEMQRARRKNEFDSIINPLMSQCNGENRTVENLENWYPLRESPFLDNIEKNNYFKIVFNDFIMDYPDLKKDIIEHDNILREFNDIYQQLVDTIETDELKSRIGKMIIDFNKDTKTRIAESDVIQTSTFARFHILGNTDLNNNTIGEPFKIFWKKYGNELLKIRKRKNVRGLFNELNRMTGVLKVKNKELVEQLEEISNEYTKEYGISLDDELKFAY